MIYQFPEFMSDIFMYMPIIISIAFAIAMLAIGYLIRKNNRYTYGLYFIISAIFAIIPNIIFFALNYPSLTITLFVTLALPFAIVAFIITLINTLFTVLNVISAIFLFLALYSVYKTHSTPRTEPNTK